MSALEPPRRRWAPGGPEVTVNEVMPGDFAYAFGYWFKVVEFFPGNGDQVYLERPGWPRREQASVRNITRWRKA